MSTIHIDESSKRVAPCYRFTDDVLTKEQMKAWTDKIYPDGYAVLEKETKKWYIYEKDAEPNEETGKFRIYQAEEWRWEVQIKGWTKITPDLDEELDINPQLQAWYKRFTILVYLRKWTVRQGVKYELTSAELEKIFSKIQKNMVCITRTCINPSGSNAVATVKQCVTPVQDENWNVIPWKMNIKYQLYEYNGAVITTTLDNFEWCMYAE